MISGTPDVSDFAAQYAILSDYELLVIVAQRETLMDSAVMALDAEVARRQLNTAKTSEPAESDTKIPMDAELPYRWGRFVGGMTVVGSLLSGVAALIQQDLAGAIVAALSVVVGFGIYNMRKWAVLLLEIGTCLSLVVVVAILLIGSRSASTEGLLSTALAVLFIFVFYAPQTIYFWKRRRQLR
jgi:hypothetical protein